MKNPRTLGRSGGDTAKADCMAQYMHKKEGADMDASLLSEAARKAAMAPLRLEIPGDAHSPLGIARPESLERLSGRLADG